MKGTSKARTSLEFSFAGTAQSGEGRKGPLYPSRFVVQCSRPSVVEGREPGWKERGGDRKRDERKMVGRLYGLVMAQ